MFNRILLLRDDLFDAVTTEPARCTRRTSSCHLKVVLYTSRTEQYDRTFISRIPKAWNGLPGDIFVGPASVSLL
nr:unnamed protein product [Callosobruchus chinensis]CAH7768635.1 unnamed protein product [Callosobruchus chinensis]